MNRIFYAMIAGAVLFAAFRELVWTFQPDTLVTWLAFTMDSIHWVPASVDPRASFIQDAQPALETIASRLSSVSPVGAFEHPWAPGALEDEATKAPMEAITAGLFDAAKASVNLAIGLIGAMAFFLGLMKVAEAGGMLAAVAKAIRPVMELLFPDVPADHPAMGSMIMNMSANALGLGNAATPFGIKAMQELDSLNPEKGTATNAMALFLAINTSSVTILPTGVIVLRDVLKSGDPAGIMGTTLFATIFSTAAGITAAKVYQRFTPNPGASEATPRPIDGKQAGILALYVAGLLGIVSFCILFGSIVSPWVVPVLVLGLLSWGFFAGVPVYESFVEGAKDGFDIARKIIPYLVAILGAVGMLRASGLIDVFVRIVGPVTSKLGMPAEALPMALLRPLSGSGAYGIMTDIMGREGPDSYAGYLVSTLQGTTETTFYVIAVYFGAVQVTKIRHAMAAALTADFIGVVSAIIAVQIYFHYAGLW